MAADEHTKVPEVGALARDTYRNRLGEVMETSPTRVFLRPLGGGREWEARPSEVQPAAIERCAKCDGIKTARREATERSDIQKMIALTTLMGVHQREAH